MDTRVQVMEDKIAPKNDIKKRIHSGKRFSFGKTVQFPDWRINNDYNRTTQLIVSYKEGKKVSKLREPRNLYSLTSKQSPSINTPRWPAEIKVISERPQHLDSLPHEPEKFYNSELLGEIEDNLPFPTKPEDGEVVFENKSGNSKYFDSSQSGGNKVQKSISSSDVQTLWFESRFESGNLSKAIKIGSCDYQLWLRTDLYTEKYTQWYYFRVENTQPGKVYRFTIMNLMKSGSLYSCGMKPLMYSEQEAKEKGIGWRRVGSNIKYYKNELKREDARGEHSLYSLSWTVVFPHAKDRCYFAHCYPYTYTDLQEYLSKLCKDPCRSQYCKQRTLTRTLAGNFVYLMTITSPSKCPLEAKRKRAIVLTARVHPGESNSSWMMKGLLDYLTSDTLDAKLLRDTFVFKVIPMLNPDGVIVGNYRCSLTGRDLNRNYKTNLKEAFPSVWHTREMIKRLSQEREITLYCDFHGHSRQQNVFIYGCENRANLDQGFKERVFPMMMSQNCKDKFCFKRCKFRVQKSKSGTGRVVMWNLGISNSYTMEATFCGSTLGSRAGEHFTTADFESMGYHLCDTLLDYCDPDTSKYFAILNEVEIYVKSLILERMKEKGLAEPDMKLSDVDLGTDYVTSDSSPSGSDSSVSDGLPMHLIYAEKEESKAQKKKKCLKTRKERNKRRTRIWDKQTQDKEPVKPSEEKRTQAAKNNRGNDFPDGGLKNTSYRGSSRQKNTKTPSLSVSHDACKTATTPEHFAEIQGYESALDSIGRNDSSTSFYGQSIPHLRYSGKEACFGLAPATPSRGLNRWSAEKKKENTSNDEEESSFIGRYMARQIRLTIQRKDGHKTSPKPVDPLEVARKVHRCDSSYKTIATAQAGDWEGRIEEVRTRGDRKVTRGQYCARHAAEMRKDRNENERMRRENFQPLEGNKIYSSQENVGSRTSQQSRTRQTTKIAPSFTNASDVQKDTLKTRLDKRGNSDNNFPLVNFSERTKSSQINSEKRVFNFRGVAPKTTKSGYDLSHEHRNSSSTDNGYFSFVDNKEKQDSGNSARVSLSDNVLGRSSPLPSSYEKYRRTHTAEEVTASTKGDNLNSSEQNLPKDSDEMALKAVGRLRKKIQNLNSLGHMVDVAANNQHSDGKFTEEDSQESLLNDFRNFQINHNGGHRKTIFQEKSSYLRQKKT
ncbi:cytosolic carboxypeptidase 2-like isoform X3 [Dendronephthya gigantea]|uniref:cytosolic carboxypeptidase 2-like isoform X3 n=1 Tax=Dendronephthya gigantea TaxID=151771 RepID=UPI00106D566F|nr:cytosolic carboxypeptidase 2-like isoform X3 [Dendronephthya gigantea]